MPTRLETALWIGALACAVAGHAAYMTPELCWLAEQLVAVERPRVKA